MTNDRDQSSTAEELRKSSEEFKSTVRDEAQGIRDKVEEEVSRRAGETRDTLAGEVGDFGEALRSASGELRRGSPQEQMVTAAANALEEFSGHLRGRDFGQILNEVNEYGRRNPLGFLGGAALLGFAGMRLAKASQRRRPIEHEGEVTPPSPAPSAATGRSVDPDTATAQAGYRPAGTAPDERSMS